MLVRGALLNKLQKLSDFLPILEEAQKFLSNREGYQYLKRVFVKDFPFSWDIKDRVVFLLNKARTVAIDIKQDLSILESDSMKEKRIIKEFMLYMFENPFEREIIRLVAFNVFEGESINTTRMKFSLFLLIIYSIVSFAGIITIGILLGSKSTSIILNNFIVAFFFDSFIFQIFFLWFRYVFLFSFSRMYLASILHLLHHRTEFLISRNFYLMRNTFSFLQRINPACRASRAFPNLPISRLVRLLLKSNLLRLLNNYFNFILLPLVVNG